VATDKPRIQVTVDRNLYNTIKRMAKLQGKSMSAVCGELLEAVHMPLMRTVALLEAAAEAPAQVRQGLAQVATSIEREMVGVAGSALAQMDWALGQLEGASGAADAPAQPKRPQARKGRKKGSNPRSSNTGVRSGRQAKKGGA